MIALDTSALTKLIVMEPESRALIEVVRHRELIAADLVRTELRRAVARVAPGELGAADQLLARLRLVHLQPALLDDAGRLGPPNLRTLDAVHLQCALTLGDELEALVTYDVRQAEAARDAGLTVISPA